MPIELGGVRLDRIHEINSVEQAQVVTHQVPGLEGDVVQDLGRQSVRLRVGGIFYGESALDDLASLRELHLAREPVDFLADIVGQAYFAQVIVERLEVAQLAAEPDQFSYQLTIAEFVEPPRPAPPGIDDVSAAIELEAAQFMDLLQLPDLLALPGFGDPTEPLTSILDDLGGVLDGLTGSARELQTLFTGE